MATRGQKATNIWVARIIPILLISIITYSAFVITKVVAIDYLLNPSSDLLVQPRPGSAAAILFFYYLLLIPLLVCYARLIQTTITNPGYVPRGAAWLQQQKERSRTDHRQSRGHHSRRRSAPHLIEKTLPSRALGNPDLESGGSNHSSLTANKKNIYHYSHSRNNSTEIPFWQRDIFVCNPDGRPPFCSTCLTHKPDRTHHCSEVDRCVLKMDHFCPWVGGIVSETTFKYFIQFLIYAALFCLIILTTTAVFIAERRRIDSGFLDVHFYLLLGLSALFLLFTIGMAASSIQLSLVNSSTVENLSRKSKVWFLAVLIPRDENGRLPGPPTMDRQGGTRTAPFQTITYPRPAAEEQFLTNQARGDAHNNPPLPPSTTTTTNPTSTSTFKPRTFAILSTQPGENPFDIGTWENICQVMGYTVNDWLFPIKQSPCVDHRSRVSAFRMNDEMLKRLKEEAGLVQTQRDGKRSRSRRDRGAENENENEHENAGGRGSGSGSGSGAEDYGSRRKKRRRRRSRRSEGEKEPR